MKINSNVTLIKLDALKWSFKWNRIPDVIGEIKIPQENVLYTWYYLLVGKKSIFKGGLLIKEMDKIYLNLYLPYLHFILSMQDSHLLLIPNI